MGASEALVVGSTPAEEITSRPSFSGETGLKDYRGSTPHDELVHILSIRSECGATRGDMEFTGALQFRLA